MWISHAVKKTKQSSAKNLIGPRIREARLRLQPSVSQNDLAGKLAVRGILLDQTAISRIESGSRYVMDYEAVAIARSLKVSVAWLFGEQN
jgi:HTH-type transcriptional regulator, cell division transcriptional repressor